MVTTYLWDEGIQIAIWGTGKLGKFLYHKYKKHYDIICFYDNNPDKRQGKLYDLEIKEFLVNDDCKILIASCYSDEIEIQLMKMGLKVYKDYLPYWLFEYDSINYYRMWENYGIECSNWLIRLMKKDKKLAATFGNCQVETISNALKTNDSFTNYYIIVFLPGIFMYHYNPDVIKIFQQQELWRMLNVCIIQKIEENNKFHPVMSTNNIISKVEKNCDVIILLNIYFSGYFPQIKRNDGNCLQEISRNGLFRYGDKYIEELYHKGYDADHIIEIIRSSNFISAKEIQAGVDASLNELEKRQKQCDIKILDYILKFYKEEQIFYSPDHPANHVIFEYTSRILDYLGIEDSNQFRNELFEWNRYTLRTQGTIVYPSVIYHLGIKKFPNVIIPNLGINAEFVLDFNEYVKKYIEICL